MTKLAQKGDEVPILVFEEAEAWLDIGLAGFVNIFNPEVIVLGDGVAKADEFILGPAREEIRFRAHSRSPDLVKIKEATLGPRSSVLGAAALVRDPSGEYLLGP